MVELCYKGKKKMKIIHPPQKKIKDKLRNISNHAMEYFMYSNSKKIN